MSTVAFIRRCLDVGMDFETALMAAEAFEATVSLSEMKATKPLSAGALRTRKYRENLKSDRHEASPTVTDETPVTHVAECESVTDRHEASPNRPSRVYTRVVDSSLPSLRSEELITPLTKPPVSIPRKAKKPPRPTWRRCPEDWNPQPEHETLALAEGLDEAMYRRELAQFRDHEFGKPHSDADASFRTWLRNAAKFGGLNGTTTARADRWGNPDRARKISNLREGTLDFVNGGR